MGRADELRGAPPTPSPAAAPGPCDTPRGPPAPSSSPGAPGTRPADPSGRQSDRREGGVRAAPAATRAPCPVAPGPAPDVPRADPSVGVRSVIDDDSSSSTNSEKSNFDREGGSQLDLAATSSTSTDSTETTQMMTITMKSASAKPRRRGAGWGIPPGMGLRGGADTISNGTSGWGPPPAASSNPGNAGGGWGAAPPPSASASAAWGSPNPAEDAVNGAGPSSNNGATSNGANAAAAAALKAQQQQQQQPGQVPAQGQSSSAPGQQSNASAAAGATSQASSSSQPPQGASSWAAAAGKGLPPSSDAGASNGSSSSTNKQLEHLNSVREALFSQDGWGGGNVKQDTAWDVDARPNGAPSSGVDGASSMGAQAAAAPKDPTMWGGPPRNDGTDLWKSTLSGQPPAPKPQPANPWGHTPQNPTDFKQWGEEDDGGGDSGNTWRPDHPPGPYNNKPHDGWKSHNMSNTWNNDGPGGGGMGGGRDMMPPPHDVGGGWGAPPMPRQPNPGQWGAPPGRWDHDSPTPGRRPYGHGGPMDDPSGTSLWGNKGASKWQDMPSMARGGPPGPGPRGMMVGGPKEPWGHGGPGGGGMHRGGAGGGWGDDPMSKGGGWGEDPMKRDAGNWGAPGGGGPGGDGQWNKPPRGMMPGAIRSSPSWDEPGGGGGMDGGWNSKQMEIAKQKELIWNSKSFKILCDLGYRKEDVEHALRVCNLRMEDAMEMLNQNGAPGRRMPPQHDMPFGGPDNPMGDPRAGSHFPGYPQDPTGVSQPGMPGGGNPGGLGLNAQMQSRMGSGGLGNVPTNPLAGGNVMPPPRQQQPPNQPSQPSAQQLRLLVQQIQMAVQAGHLNPQILNQPLAPQTLLLLNQLLQQIKQLQQLQQQHQLASRGNPNNPALMQVTVNITKTKQTIQNLQNQISAQQANYLKSQLPNAVNPASGGGANLAQVGGPGSVAHEGGTSTVQEMFNGISLMGSDAPAGNGSRLNQWKLPANKGEFPKAPGPANSNPAGAKGGQQPSADPFGNGPWGKNPDPSTGSGWPDSSKSSTTPTDSDFGIPEFEPGKPWKGPGLKNPDEDPNLTPGSVAALSIGPLTKAVSSTSLATSSGAEVSTLGLTSSTWSSHGGHPKNEASNQLKEAGQGGNWPSKGAAGGGGAPVTTASGSGGLTSQIGQDLWGAKTPASSAGGRPGPPGLSQPATSTPGGWPSASNGWSTNSGAPGEGGSGAGGAGGAGWLILKNLTPQIDGSTLKTLCMQHGPLQHFDLYLNHSIALVMYASGREAAKAQKALNNCLLGNTTIHANMTSESEVSAILQQLGVSNAAATAAGGSGGQSGGGAGGPSTPTRGGTPAANSLLPKSSSGEGGGWGDSAITSVATSVAGGSSGAGGPLFGGGGSVWGAPDSSNTLHPFLPGDLLGENNMSA